VDLSSTEDLRAFAGAVEAIPADTPDGDVARYVASGLHGICKGLEDAGDLASAQAVRFASAELVRDLASGAWRAEIEKWRASGAAR
jgi:hypothetical protein